MLKNGPEQVCCYIVFSILIHTKNRQLFLLPFLSWFFVVQSPIVYKSVISPHTVLPSDPDVFRTEQVISCNQLGVLCPALIV